MVKTIQKKKNNMKSVLKNGMKYIFNDNDVFKLLYYVLHEVELFMKSKV